MKISKNLKAFGFGAFLLALAISYGCSGESDKQGASKPNIPVTVYKLEKLDTQKSHGITSDSLRGIVSSLDGSFVYLVGSKPQQLKTYDATKKAWTDTLDWSNVKKAENHAENGNIGGMNVGAFRETTNGMLFTVSNEKGLVVVKGTGNENAIWYPQGAGNTSIPAGKYTPMQVVDSNKNNLLFLFKTEGVAKHGVLFRKFVDPKEEAAAEPWDSTLTVDNIFVARVQDHNRNLLLADSVSGGVRRLNAQSIGVTKLALDNGGLPVYKAENLRLDGKTRNIGISDMVLVDGKYLLIGLKSTNINNGGLVFADITQTTPKWSTFGKGMGLTVDSISTERVKNAKNTKVSAIVTTNKGYLIFSKGSVIEPVEKKGYLINHKFISDVRAVSNNYEKAQSGFAGDRFTDPGKGGYKSAAQDSQGNWFLPITGKTPQENGVFKLVIETHQVEAARAASSASDTP